MREVAVSRTIKLAGGCDSAIEKVNLSIFATLGSEFDEFAIRGVKERFFRLR